MAAEVNQVKTWWKSSNVLKLCSYEAAVFRVQR